MIPQDPRDIAMLLQGAAFGVLLYISFTGLALYFDNIRRAVREGTPLAGEAMERNRKRGES